MNNICLNGRVKGSPGKERGSLLLYPTPGKKAANALNGFLQKVVDGLS